MKTSKNTCFNLGVFTLAIYIKECVILAVIFLKLTTYIKLVCNVCLNDDSKLKSVIIKTI
jgi:hypothetical protein